MKRFLKQLFYGIFYLALLAGIFYVGYGAFFRPAPSCFDGIKNQGEEGVDCGSICGKVCLPAAIQSVAADSSAKIFPLAGGRVSLLFKLQNPNPDFAVKDLTYEIKVSDAAGNLLKTISDHSFIYAGEVKYIGLPAVDFGNAAPSAAEVSLKNPVWAKESDFQKASLEIQSSAVRETSTTVEAAGRAVNTDAVAFPKVLIVAVYNDNYGNQIGVSGTELEDITPGESRNFTVIHPALPELNPAGTELYIYAARP